MKKKKKIEIECTGYNTIIRVGKDDVYTLGMYDLEKLLTKREWIGLVIRNLSRDISKNLEKLERLLKVVK